MGLWKILLGVSVGVCLTESGRESIVKIIRQILDMSQSVAEKSCLTVESVQSTANECANEIQSKAKEFVDHAQSKSKQFVEAIKYPSKEESKSN